MHFLNGNVCILLRPGLAALNNLDDKFVAGWLLPSKVLNLSYPEDATVAKTAFLSFLSIDHSIINVEKLQLWCANSGCNTRHSKYYMIHESSPMQKVYFKEACVSFSSQTKRHCVIGCSAVAPPMYCLPRPPAVL